MIKRIFDVLIALVGLVLCAPVFIAVALLIKLTSPGPVFFMQTRMGKKFRSFSIYKFRTMSWEVTRRGPQITVGEDPRITKIGRWLRHCKLDELPQLINVLKGEMSLVGPRPEVPQYVNMFKERYAEILTVLPGITDLASLKYIAESTLLSNSDKPEEEYVERILPEKIRLATVYIEHAGFLFDLLIIAQTFFRLMQVQVVIFKLPEVDPYFEERTTGAAPTLRRMTLKYRRALIVLFDLALIVLANYLAFWLRFDGSIPDGEWGLFLQMLPWLMVIRGIAFFIFHMNKGLWRYVSIWDFRNIVSGVLSSTLIFYAVTRWGLSLVSYPQSIFIIDSVLLVGFLIGIRLPFRLYREAGIAKGKKRVLIVGAGDTGEGLVREIKSNSANDCEPIGFIDDDPSILGQRIHGIKVLGTRKDLPKILAIHQPQEVLIALPDTDPAAIREVLTALESYKIPIKRLPNLKDFLDGKITISQIRNLAIEDLLARPPVGLMPQAVRHLIQGKRVLVTGAGGSIGSELCRQIAGFHPENLILYERYENSLYAISGQLSDSGYASVIHPVIGDITDVSRVHSTLDRYRPHIIFHAAAHKHVPLMELNPGEAIKNNILGTHTMAEAADLFGVERFVLISTDKAVNPSSVMGATKRGAELFVQGIARRSQTSFHTVRFGNVLGSNGSVVPRFQEQIKAGGPVTVTHPEVQRYFMLIPEAVHLVLQAAALGEQGGLYILEMGEQVKLVDLARNLIQLSGFVPEKEIAIEFIGLRAGEKLEEELIGTGENTEASSIDKILRIRSDTQPDMTFLMQKLKEFEQTDAMRHPHLMIEHLHHLVPSFQPKNSSGQLVMEVNSELVVGASHSPESGRNGHWNLIRREMKLNNKWGGLAAFQINQTSEKHLKPYPSSSLSRKSWKPEAQGKNVKT